MSLVSQKELEETTNYSRQSDIVKWLNNHGVKYWIGKNGAVVTTTEAINAALLGQATNDTTVEFI